MQSFFTQPVSCLYLQYITWTEHKAPRIFGHCSKKVFIWRSWASQMYHTHTYIWVTNATLPWKCCMGEPGWMPHWWTVFLGCSFSLCQNFTWNQSQQR